MPPLRRHLRRAVTRTLLVASLGLAGFVTDPVAAADLLIENVTLISPERAAPVVGQWVHVRDGRIAAISDKAINVPANTPYARYFLAASDFARSAANSVPGFQRGHSRELATLRPTR